MQGNDTLADIKSIPIPKVLALLGVEFDETNPRHIRCPFPAHGATGRTPSFKVYVKYNRFVCFGCGIKGSTLDLVVHGKEIDLPQAIQILAKEFNIATNSSSNVNALIRNLTGETEDHRHNRVTIEIRRQVERHIVEILWIKRRELDKLGDEERTVEKALLETFSETMFSELDRLVERDAQPEDYYAWSERQEEALSKTR